MKKVILILTLVLITYLSYGQGIRATFNPKTEIFEFSLQEKAFVNFSIYNLKGQLVRTLVSENKDSGIYTFKWDREDKTGKRVVSGIYFYKMTTGRYTATRKIVLLK